MYFINGKRAAKNSGTPQHSGSNAKPTPLAMETSSEAESGINDGITPPLDNLDITLVTQLQFNRISHLERLLQAWQGPSMVAIYLSDEETDRFLNYVNKTDTLRQANASYHVVYKRHVSTRIERH